jgi:hypothetical protein
MSATFGIAEVVDREHLNVLATGPLRARDLLHELRDAVDGQTGALRLLPLLLGVLVPLLAGAEPLVGELVLPEEGFGFRGRP